MDTHGLTAKQSAALTRRVTLFSVSTAAVLVSLKLASNLIALAGIAASALLGIANLDAVAAILVAALLLWGAVSVFREASAQLMDRELSDQARARIVALMTEDPRLTHVHQLRTR